MGSVNVHGLLASAIFAITGEKIFYPAGVSILLTLAPSAAPLGHALRRYLLIWAAPRLSAL